MILTRDVPKRHRRSKGFAEIQIDMIYPYFRVLKVRIRAAAGLANAIYVKYMTICPFLI